MSNICIYVQFKQSKLVHIMSSYFFSAGNDYLPVNALVTFTSGVQENCFNVTALDDSVEESTEELSIQCTLASTSETAVLIRNTTTVTIIDDDGEFMHGNTLALWMGTYAFWLVIAAW